MFDFKSALAKQIDKSKAKYRLTDMTTWEVSLVDRAANLRRFITIKSAGAGLPLRLISPAPPPAPVAKGNSDRGDQRDEADLDASARALAKQSLDRGPGRRQALERDAKQDVDRSLAATAKRALDELDADAAAVRAGVAPRGRGNLFDLEGDRGVAALARRRAGEI